MNTPEAQISALPGRQMKRQKMNAKEKEIDRIKQLLGRKGCKIVIVTHKNPDGDAIGSSL